MVIMIMKSIVMESVKPGQIVLRGGDELFFNEHVRKFYDYVLDSWRPPSKKIALYMGCSWHKPFSHSFMHLKVIRMLEKHNLADNVQQFIISEPLTICPRELETRFPAANYDFPPERLGEKGRAIFIERLRKFIEKYKDFYSFHVGFMPNHHKRIFDESSRGVLRPFYIPYNVYQLPNLLKLLKQFQSK